VELDADTFEKAVVKALHGLGFRELKVAKRSKDGPLLTARKRDGSSELRFAIRILRAGAALDRGSVQELRRDLGHRLAMPVVLEDLAGLAGRQQQWERAARLLGAAEAVCADLGTTLPIAIVDEYWRTVRGARSAMGEAAFTAAWAAGRAMSLEEAARAALQENELPTQSREHP